MTITLVQAIAGLAALYFGGEVLIRGASDLATRLGVSPLAVGLTVVAFGTSAPELVVSVDAALSGAPEISVGNVVGSNIANAGLILGSAALIRPMAVKADLVRFDGPVMIVACLGLVAVLVDDRASRLEGGFLLLALAAYTIFTFWQARREPEPIREEFASRAPGNEATIPASVARVVGGLAFLMAGGHLLVTAAVALATALGISEAVVGLTIVAVGTSLPELSTSLVASTRGQGDIATGNVVGSNIFNVLGILGVTAVVHPPEAAAITDLDLGTMVAFAVVLAVLLATRLRLGRVEGAVLVAGYLAYSLWLLAG